MRLAETSYKVSNAWSTRDRALPGRTLARNLIKGRRGGGASMAATIQKEGLKELELAKTVLAADSNTPSCFEASCWHSKSTLQCKKAHQEGYAV